MVSVNHAAEIFMETEHSRKYVYKVPHIR